MTRCLWRIGVSVMWLVVFSLATVGAVLACSMAVLQAAFLGLPEELAGNALGVLFACAAVGFLALVPIGVLLLILGLLGKLPGTAPHVSPRQQIVQWTHVLLAWLRKLGLSIAWAAAVCGGLVCLAPWLGRFTAWRNLWLKSGGTIPGDDTLRALVIFAPQLLVPATFLLGLFGVLPGTRLRKRPSPTDTAPSDDAAQQCE